MVIIAGGIDLSAGSMVAFSATTCALVLTLCAAPDDRRLVTVGPAGIAAAIAAALLSQQLASKYLSTTHSGFLGAIVSVVFAMLATRIKTAPPAMVMLIAAFWSLVPGALSFMSVSEAATGGNADVASMSQAGAAILSIALGTLVGWSIFHTIDSRLPWSKTAAQQP